MTEQEFNNLKPLDIIYVHDTWAWEVQFIDGETLIIYEDHGKIDVLEKQEALKNWKIKK